MGFWNPTQEREDRKAACVGLYNPFTYKVRVDDTHVQSKLRLACNALWGQGVSVSWFLLWCAEYVIARHRELKGVRKIIREIEREIAREKKKREGRP